MNSASPAPALSFAVPPSSPRLRVPPPLSGWSVLFRVLLVCVLTFVLSMALLAWSLLPRGEVRELRRAALSELPGDWKRLVEVRGGGVLCSAGQFAATLAGAPLEVVAALDCVNSVEVSVHQRTRGSGGIRGDATAANLLEVTSARMAARGWDPLVQARSRDSTVAVFLAPTNMQEKVRLCVLVHDGDQLVVVACDGRLEPLLRILEARSLRDWVRRVEQI